MELYALGLVLFIKFCTTYDKLRTTKVSKIEIYVSVSSELVHVDTNNIIA